MRIGHRAGADLSIGEAVIKDLWGIDADMRIAESTTFGNRFGFEGRDNCGPQLKLPYSAPPYCRGMHGRLRHVPCCNRRWDPARQPRPREIPRCHQTAKGASMSRCCKPAHATVACALLTLIALPGTASADAVSSAVIRDLRIGVVDLTPHDAVTAGYNITTASTWATADLVPDNTSPLVMSGQDREQGWFGAAQQNWSQGTMYSRANSLNGVLSASGRIGGNLFAYYHADTLTSADWGGGTGLSSGLNIAPHTQLTITADYSLDASIDRACPADPPIGSVCEIAQATVYVDWFGAVGALDSRRADLDLRNTTTPASRSGTLSFTLTNDSDEWKSEGVTFITQVYGQVGLVTAVPEPTTTALTGIGLFGVGWSVRRRRRG